MQLINVFNKPYPFIQSTLHKLLLSSSFGAFIFLFLVVFEPFDIDTIVDNKIPYLLGFGLITVVVMNVNYILLPLLLPKVFDPYQWTVAKEITFLLFNLLIITFLNNYYNSIYGNDSAQELGLSSFVLRTISIGIFPIAFFIFITEIFLSRKKEHIAAQLSHEIQGNQDNFQQHPTNILAIHSESKKDHLELDLNAFFFAKSEGNYSKIYYRDADKISHKLLRLSLKKLEQQLSSTSNILRCHRSYLVNKQRIIAISGNARSYNLQFENCEEKVPVSRSFDVTLLN